MNYSSKGGCSWLILLFILLIWLIGTLIFWLINLCAYIGATFILLVDYAASPFTIIGIERPEIGWFVLGGLVGGTLGLIQALKRTGRSSELYKVYLAAIALVLILQAVAYSKWQSQFDTTSFQNVVLQENFTSPQNWRLAEGAAIKDGGLFQLQPQANWAGWSIWEGRSFADVDFSADVAKVNGSDEVDFGLLARVNGENNQDFYYLKVDGNGDFAMGKHLQDKWEDKVSSQETENFRVGNTINQLRIVCKGNIIMGFINDKRVGLFRDTSYNSGKIAVHSARGEENAVAVYFDNVVVKE